MREDYQTSINSISTPMSRSNVKDYTIMHPKGPSFYDSIASELVSNSRHCEEASDEAICI